MANLMEDELIMRWSDKPNVIDKTKGLSKDKTWEQPYPSRQGKRIYVDDDKHQKA